MDGGAGVVMHGGAMPAHAFAAQPGMEGMQMQMGLALAEPMMHHHGETGRVSYDTTEDMGQHVGGRSGSLGTGGSALLGRKHAPDRRPLRFWQPFNDWWRAELERLGRRPTSQEIGEWYERSADMVWADTKPTLQETRVHAKCLRSLPLVRDYFRNYRAKKKAKTGDGPIDGEDGEGDTEDGGDNAGGGRRGRRGSRKRGGDGMDDPSNSDYNRQLSGVMQGMGTMEMMQAQQGGMMLPHQFWGGVQSAEAGTADEEYTRALMLQQHLQAAMLQQQMAAAAVAAQQFGGQHFGVFPSNDEDDDDEETDPGDGQAAAASAPADAGAEVASGLGALAPAAAAAGAGGQSDPSMPGVQQHDGHVVQSAGQPAAAGMDGMLQEMEQRDPAVAAAAAEVVAAAAAAMDRYLPHAGNDSMIVQRQQHVPQDIGDIDDMAAAHEHDMRLDAAAEAADAADAAAMHHGFAADSAAIEPGVHDGDDEQDAAGPAHHTAAVHVAAMQHKLDHMARLGAGIAGLPATEAGAAAGAPGPGGIGSHNMQQQQPHHQQQLLPGMAGNSHGHSHAHGQHTHYSQPGAADMHYEVGDDGVPLQQDMQQVQMQAPQPSGLHLGDVQLGVAAAMQHVQQQHHGMADGGVVAEQPAMTSPPRQQQQHQSQLMSQQSMGQGEAPRAPEQDEVVLLREEDLLAMSQELLMAHIKAVQEELYGKRELLKRSFDQLRRTQERLGRRERKLAKEQQKCRQYQQALAAWQQSLVPLADPAAQELYTAQMQVAMAAQAAAQGTMMQH